MQVCPNCKHQNRPGVVFCDNCGASLIGELPIGTRNMNRGGDSARLPGTGGLSSLPSNPHPSILPAQGGTSTFGQLMMLRLVIDGGEPLVFKPQQEMILGRRDPATGAQPDIDLTPYAGYRMGVSRRHAAIRRSAENQLELWDLGSSNGTFLNGSRLVSYRPNRLRDGDEIRLGQMAMRIYFEIPANPQENRAKTSPFTTSGALPRTGSLPRPGGTGGLLGRLGTGPLGNGNNVAKNNPLNGGQSSPASNGTGQPPSVKPDELRESKPNSSTPPTK